MQTGLPYGQHLLHGFVIRKIGVAVRIYRHGPQFQILLRGIMQIFRLFSDVFGYFVLQARLEFGPTTFGQSLHLGISEQMGIPYRILHIERIRRGGRLAVGEIESPVVEIPNRSGHEFAAAVLVHVHAARVPYLVMHTSYMSQ